MNLLLTFFAATIFVFLLTMIARRISRKSEENGIWPFYARKLMSSPEQALYYRLCKALPDHIVMSQVSLSRILGVKKGNNFGKWFNRINRMSADFVVCSKDASVIAVIELDDSTHSKKERISADFKKDKALSSAGIRVIRWNVKSMPEDTAIRAAINF